MCAVGGYVGVSDCVCCCVAACLRAFLRVCECARRATSSDSGEDTSTAQEKRNRNPSVLKTGSLLTLVLSVLFWSYVGLHSLFIGFPGTITSMTKLPVPLSSTAFDPVSLSSVAVFPVALPIPGLFSLFLLWLPVPRFPFLSSSWYNL